MKPHKNPASMAAALLGQIGGRKRVANLTAEELRESCRAAGIASGAARRAKRLAKDSENKP